MVSVLGAYVNNSGLFPTMASEQDVVFNRIQQQTSARFQEKKDVIDEAYKQRQAQIEAESNRWVTVKADIFNAKAAVDSGKESIARIANLLLEMRTPVYEAGLSGEDPELRSQQFNAKLNALNNEADRMGRAFNLIGSIDRDTYTPNTIEYRNDLGTGVTRLTGGYAGADYRIESNDGTVWVPDLGVNTLTQYSELQGMKRTLTIATTPENVVIDKTASYDNAISVASYNAETGAITLNIRINPDAAPEVVTGTLKKAGIGLMPAWFYDGLNTQAGRERAYRDINEAEARLSLASGAVEAAAGRVSVDARRADDQINELNRQNSNALVKQLEESQKLQVEYQQQVQAMLNNLDQLSRQQQNYLSAFASEVSSNPILSVTV